MSHKALITVISIGFGTLGTLGVAWADGLISNDRIQSCIVSTCGSPEVNRNGSSAFDNIQDIQSHEAKALSRVLEAEILKLANDQYSNGLKKAELLAKEISKNEPLNLTASQRILFSFMKVGQGIGGRAKKLLPYDVVRGTVEVDPKERDIYFATLKPEAIEATNMVLNRVFLEIYKAAFRTDNIENAVQARLKRLYPQLPLKEALAKDGKFLLGLNARVTEFLGKELGPFFSDESELQVLHQAAEGKDINAIQTGTYEKIARNLDIFSKLLEPDLAKALAKYPLDLQSDMKLLRDSKLAEKKMAETREYSPSIAAKLANTCQAYLRFSFDGNTSELRIRKFQPVIAQVKSMAKIAVAKMTDETTRAELEKAIDDIQFSFPTTNAERLESIRGVLETEKLSVLKEQKELASNSRTLILFSALSDYFNSEPETLVEKINTKSPLWKACEGLPVTATSDFALTALGKVSISWYTLAFPDRGATILAHEIGHVVSAKLRRGQLVNPQANKEFSKSLSCVANRNPFTKGQVVLQGGSNTPWSEEDWADHFSSLVMEEFSKRGHVLGNAPNLGCTLVDNTRGSYSNNKLEAGETSSHSASFLRLLLIGQDRKQLNSECRAILQQVAPTLHQQCH